MNKILRWKITYYDNGGKTIIVSADSALKAVMCVKIMTNCEIIGTELLGKPPKGVAW